MIFIFFAPEKLNLVIFCLRVQYWDQKHNMANIVPFSTNQIADIFYISDKLAFMIRRSIKTFFHSNNNYESTLFHSSL